MSLNNLAGLYREQEKFPYAEPLFRRALAISEKVYGPEHPNVATGLENLAQLYRDIGYAGKARSLDRRASAIREKEKKRQWAQGN